MKSIAIELFIFLILFNPISSFAATCIDLAALKFESHMDPSLPIDFIIVGKSDLLMYTLHNSLIVNKYSISIGQNSIGKKQIQGDLRTPEGLYSIGFKNPQSNYLRSLFVTYPNLEDKKSAQKLKKSPGGDIFIHGFPLDQTERELALSRHWTTKDWTQGCIAVSDEEILELYKNIKVNTPILICP